MKLLFRLDNTCQSDKFEELYEPELRMTLEEKQAFLEIETAVRVLVYDREVNTECLIGEIFGCSLLDYDGELLEEEAEYNRLDAFYVMGTTVLPEYQGKGIGKLLVTYLNGVLAGRGYEVCLGHVTSIQMQAIRWSVGAKLGKITEKWYGTDRTAVFYAQPL